MPRPGIRKRFFAWALQKTDSINKRIYSEYKRELFRDFQGTVVEIGPGTGVNLSYLSGIREWIGIEPNAAFHSRIDELAEQIGINARIVDSSAEEIPIADNSADAVIATLVLCSVADPAKVVLEMKRILKPGAKAIFIEHVAAPQHTALRTAQNIFNPLNQLIADGCHCNRETWKVIEGAGFAEVSLTNLRVREMFKLHEPHIVGYAVK
jgi:ubiquinone/menaquinone biosynthesis C-methylase UbiE